MVFLLYDDLKHWWSEFPILNNVIAIPEIKLLIYKFHDFLNEKLKSKVVQSGNIYRSVWCAHGKKKISSKNRAGGPSYYSQWYINRPTSIHLKSKKMRFNKTELVLQLLYLESGIAKKTEDNSIKN